MTTAGRGRCLGLLCAWVSACASTTPLPVRAGAGRAPAASFPDDTNPLPRYHSKRLALSLPLPRGAHWRIDDHSRPELEANEPITHSRVLVAILHTETLVGRSQCEERAVAAKLVPDGRFQTVDDEVATTQGSFDTRIRVAVAPPDHDGAPLVGHVFAFGGYLRKCYVFDFSTEVAQLTDEPALSSRLAFARTRILGGLALEGLGASSRLAPGDVELGLGR